MSDNIIPAGTKRSSNAVVTDSEIEKVISSSAASGGKLVAEIVDSVARKSDTWGTAATDNEVSVDRAVQRNGIAERYDSTCD